MFLAKTYYGKSLKVLQVISQITDKLLRISGQCGYQITAISFAKEENYKKWC